ncbi:EF-hand [Glarea lozoyensis ATCC 20868]|uniref:Calmodulin n=1 Tax=Glarea lozoyensis (strain ATCC 20868 / MF5171) TaxID=1116229 RepID=S3D9S1_GLAL2|nr:EF-hand [Glarea lozoyensis ATCC 20868]EPE33874.1 EF-hand [Glarea lozoyensis ATCC 20868]
MQLHPSKSEAQVDAMAKPVSPEEVAILKEAFDAYDDDKTGTISVEEFAKVMKSTGQNPTEAEVQQIIDEVDLDGDGTISFDEFISMMTGGRSRHPAPTAAAEEDDSDADLAKAWKEYDPSLKSSITGSQLRQLLGSLGENVSDKEVDDLMGNIDGDDKISYVEFVKFLKGRRVDENDILDGYA